jgi:hypothetical protein
VVGIPSSPGTPGGGPGHEPASFLVELRTSKGTPHDLQRMLRALRLAVSRQASAGAVISWAGALLVPSDWSCLCLLEAAEIAQVTRVLDVAGLRAAPVRRVYQLADSLTGEAYDERALAGHLSTDVPHSPKELP